MYQYQLLLSCFKLVCTCKFLCILSMAALTKPFFRDVLILKLGWFIWNIWCVGHFDKTPFMQCLSRALRDENPKFLMAASTLILPFQPLMVSAIHTGIMEASSSKLMASYSKHNKQFWFSVCLYTYMLILFCLIYIIVLSVLPYPSFYLLSRPIITSFPNLRFHLLKEHQ